MTAPPTQRQSPISAAARAGNPLFWVYASGLGLILLVAVVVGLWMGIKQPMAPKEHQVVHTRVGPVVVLRGPYLVSATMAVETARNDAVWAQANVENFAYILKQVLSKADPMTAQVPNGIAGFQENARRIMNAAMKTKQVERVWLTEFLYQSVDS